jgi:hypothetical protein
MVVFGSFIFYDTFFSSNVANKSCLGVESLEVVVSLTTDKKIMGNAFCTQTSFVNQQA